MELTRRVRWWVFVRIGRMRQAIGCTNLRDAERYCLAVDLPVKGDAVCYVQRAATINPIQRRLFHLPTGGDAGA